MLQLEIVRDMLERNGIACTGFCSADKLFDEPERVKYDLVLKDIQMGGYDVLKNLRAASDGYLRTVPVLALTTREDLFHRLSEFEIHLPSLAECPEDILPMADSFREDFSRVSGHATEGFSEDAKYPVHGKGISGSCTTRCNRRCW